MLWLWSPEQRDIVRAATHPVAMLHMPGRCAWLEEGGATVNSQSS